MNKYLYTFLFACVLLFSGCRTLDNNEAKVARVTCFGLKLKMFSEFSEVSPIILYFGWTEVEYAHSKDSNVAVTADHKDISLWEARGTVERTLSIDNEK